MNESSRPAYHLTVLIGLLVVVVSCTDSADTSTTPDTARSSTTTTSPTLPATTTATSPTVQPDVQAEIDWLVTLLNGDDLTQDEYESRFTEEFRGQVSYAEGFVPLLEQFRPEGPFTVVDRSGEGARGVAVVESADGTQARVVADLDEQNRFAALTIQPADAPTLDDPPEDVAEAFERLSAIGTLRAQSAEIVEGRCVPIAEQDPAEPAPIGSVFKLYVLAALGEAVAAGEIAWDDTIVVRDELESVPSGTLQNREAGEEVSVREVAGSMISISDNTATDHLIDLLGRETIEAAMVDYGNNTPELNTPLMDTRELTALKVGPASGLRIQWIEGDVESRRSILRQISGITPGDLPIDDWTDPIDPHLVEWFASPEDMCSLAIHLMELAGSVPEVGEILAMNPGVAADLGTWEEIWFKGGSEPGLIAAWFLTEAGSRTFVTAGSVVEPEAVIDSEEAILLFAGVRDLLAP